MKLTRGEFRFSASSIEALNRMYHCWGYSSILKLAPCLSLEEAAAAEQEYPTDSRCVDFDKTYARRVSI